MGKNLDLENDLEKRLIVENTGRGIKRVSGSRWGRLIEPADEETAKRPGRGLRILAIGSWTLGLLSFEALLSMEKIRPGKVQLVGLVTDDPLDADAKISVKRRFWRYYEESQREEYEWGILHRALSQGIACYTGEVKCDAFKELLARWAPEAIIVSAFGQVIDEFIIDFPKYGIYNVHPSDLLHHQGAGPQPWEDLIERNASSTRVTLHRVSPGIDEGDIVGQSPEIHVLLPDGSTTDDVLLIGEKTLVPVEHMVKELVGALIEKKASGTTGPIDSLDFESSFPKALKDGLKEPLDPDKRGRILPLPEQEKKFTV